MLEGLHPDLWSRWVRPKSRPWSSSAAPRLLQEDDGPDGLTLVTSRAAERSGRLNITGRYHRLPKRTLGDGQRERKYAQEVPPLEHQKEGGVKESLGWCFVRFDLHIFAICLPGGSWMVALPGAIDVIAIHRQMGGETYIGFSWQRGYHYSNTTRHVLCVPNFCGWSLYCMDPNKPFQPQEGLEVAQ